MSGCYIEWTRRRAAPGSLNRNLKKARREVGDRARGPGSTPEAWSASAPKYWAPCCQSPQAGRRLQGRSPPSQQLWRQPSNTSGERLSTFVQCPEQFRKQPGKALPELHPIHLCHRPFVFAIALFVASFDPQLLLGISGVVVKLPCPGQWGCEQEQEGWPGPIQEPRGALRATWRRQGPSFLEDSCPEANWP